MREFVSAKSSVGSSNESMSLGVGVMEHVLVSLLVVLPTPAQDFAAIYFS